MPQSTFTTFRNWIWTTPYYNNKKKKNCKLLQFISIGIILILCEYLKFFFINDDILVQLLFSLVHIGNLIL